MHTVRLFIRRCAVPSRQASCGIYTSSAMPFRRSGMLCDDDGRYIGVDWLASAYRAECHRRRRRTPATDGRTNCTSGAGQRAALRPDRHPKIDVHSRQSRLQRVTAVRQSPAYTLCVFIMYIIRVRCLFILGSNRGPIQNTHSLCEHRTRRSRTHSLLCDRI